MQGSMVSVHTSSIVLGKRSYKVTISGYYALYGTTIECGRNDSETPYTYAHCYIFCTDDSLQLFHVSRTNGATVHLINCEDNNQTTNDNVTLNFIEKISNITTLVKTANDNICSNSTQSLNYDIGYPFQVENDIYNSYEKGYICCRGFRSCFGATAVISTLGNILCLGVEACRDTVLWNTGDSARGTTPNSNTASIFCLANSACVGSTMTSQNEVYCIAPSSCENSVILTAKSLYCTNNGCKNSQITNVPSIYIFDSQSDMTLFSNGILNMNVYLRGLKAGNDITIYCNDGDYCTIDCGTQNACNGLDLYCLGKCTLLCNDTQSITCPNVILSLSPSNAPTATPSRSPSQPPSTAPTVPPSPAPTISPTNAPTAPPTSAPTGELFFC